MKLDYDYLEALLSTMENYKHHTISNITLGKSLDVNTFSDPDMQDKFMGHIKVLGDYFCIECYTENYGFL